MVVEAGLGVVHHFGAGLGAKILNNDLLQVPVLLVQGAQLEQCSEALVPRFADADEDAGRKRNGGFARSANDFEPHGRIFVGRAKMRTAARAQALRRTLQHQTLRHRYASE